MGSQRGKIPSRKPCPLSPPSVGKEEEEEEEERPFFLIPRTLIFFFCAFSTSPSFLLSRPSPLVTSILLQPSMQPLLWRWGEEREGGGEDKLFPLSKEKPPPPSQLRQGRFDTRAPPPPPRRSHECGREGERDEKLDLCDLEREKCQTRRGEN